MRNISLNHYIVNVNETWTVDNNDERDRNNVR